MAQASCQPLRATVHGFHITEPEPAWVGTLYLSLESFGITKDLRARFMTRSVEIELDKLVRGRPFRGKETMTVTVSEGDTFTVSASFIGVPGSTPFYYDLNETGEITSGTGLFAGASGHVTVRGPFLSPLAVKTPPWVAEMVGVLCGVALP
jgi:hypothetical protein